MESWTTLASGMGSSYGRLRVIAQQERAKRREEKKRKTARYRGLSRPPGPSMASGNVVQKRRDAYFFPPGPPSTLAE